MTVVGACWCPPPPPPQALESLNKKDMTEIKSYGRPPALVETVMQAVMILRGNEPTWAEAKRQLGETERREGGRDWSTKTEGSMEQIEKVGWCRRKERQINLRN